MLKKPIWHVNITKPIIFQFFILQFVAILVTSLSCTSPFVPKLLAKSMAPECITTDYEHYWWTFLKVGQTSLWFYKRLNSCAMVGSSQWPAIADIWDVKLYRYVSTGDYFLCGMMFWYEAWTPFTKFMIGNPSLICETVCFQGDHRNNCKWILPAKWILKGAWRGWWHSHIDPMTSRWWGTRICEPAPQPQHQRAGNCQLWRYIQESTVITRSNITQYFMQHCVGCSRI